MPQKRPGPSVKDPEQYEALRDQGASKEKAARIANSDRHSTAKKGGRSGSYETGRRTTSRSARPRSASTAARR